MAEMENYDDGNSFVPLGYHATLCMYYVDYKGVLKLPKQHFSLVSGYFELSWIVEL